VMDETCVHNAIVLSVGSACELAIHVVLGTAPMDHRSHERRRRTDMSLVSRDR
jgi:hypothetical protein